MRYLIIGITLALFYGCSAVPPQVNDTMLAVQQDRQLYNHQDQPRAGYAGSGLSIVLPHKNQPIMDDGTCIDRASWYIQAYLNKCDELGYKRPDYIGYNDNYSTKHRTVLIQYGSTITEIEPATGLDIPAVWWME